MNIIKIIKEKIENKPELYYYNKINEGDGTCGTIGYAVSAKNTDAFYDDTNTPIVNYDEKRRPYIPLKDGRKFKINKFQAKRLDRFRQRVRGYFGYHIWSDDEIKKSKQIKPVNQEYFIRSNSNEIR